MTKPKLLFVPHYPGSLRYFEKLIPCLEKYQVVFLFTPKAKKQFLPEMISYCQRRNYQYWLIKRYSTNKFLRKIPFYYSLRETLDFQKKVKKLLEDKQIKKIISVFDTDFYNNCLFREANKIGVDTMVLQWALTTEKATDRLEKTKKSALTKIYSSLTGLLLKYLFGFNFKNLDILGGGNAQRFGVINQQAHDLFKRTGVKQEKMSVVGYLDFDLAKKTKECLDRDVELKNKLAQKYHLDLSKKNIAVFSTPFNIKDIKIFSDSQQLKYFAQIIKAVRQVFNNSEANILFKIHTAENIALYQPIEKYGIRLYGKETINEELIYFADLYLGHHSTTNFIPMIMGKDAIFLNFCQSPKIETTRKYFSIKKFISDENEFKKLLRDFKNNKLEKQYRSDERIITKNSIDKIINWIS